MAHSGSIAVTSVTVLTASSYQKECRTQPAWLNFFCAGALQEIGKSTSLTFVPPGDLPRVSATALAVAKSATKPDFRIVLAIRFNHMARLLGGALVGKIEQCCSSPEVQRFYGSHAIARCIFAANNSENSERGFR